MNSNMYASHNNARRRSMMIDAGDVLAMQRQLVLDDSDDDVVEVRRLSGASRRDTNVEATSDTAASTPRSDGGGDKDTSSVERAPPASSAHDDACKDKGKRQTSFGDDTDGDKKRIESNTDTTVTDSNRISRSEIMTQMQAQRHPSMSLINQSRSMRRLAMEQSHHGRPAGNVPAAPESDVFPDELDVVPDGDYGGDDSYFKLGDPLHESTACLGPSRDAVGRAINLNYVQWGIMFLIVVNSLILGALTFLHGPENKSSREALETTNLALLIVFTVELTAQSYYLGLQFFRQGWLLFDAFVIVLSWAFEGSDLAVMRSFRIFRLFAMVNKWTSLRHLFKAIGKTMPKMGTIAAVLVLFFYSFSVFYTNLYFGLYEEGYLDWDYFGRLDLTFLTLFQVMTMDSWTVMVRQLMESGHHWAWVGFVIWVIITAFFFVSLIVAVVCESLFELNDIKEKKRQKKMFKHQNNVVKNQTRMLMDENKQLLEIQKEMLANQIVMQKTLMEVVDQLREYKKRDAGDNDDNGDNGDNGASASQLETADQSLSEQSMSNLLATFAADGTIRGGASEDKITRKQGRRWSADGGRRSSSDGRR